MNEPDIYTDALTALAKGTDAGCYRLTPEKVIVVRNEEEVKQVLAESLKSRKSVTFKGSGTSLSGQAVTDSLLVEVSPDFGKPMVNSVFENPRISIDGRIATFPCSMTGGEANRLLKKYGRRLGPDPASIESASIGGIVANNASGARSGLHNNSYYTIENMQVILADGTVLDTASNFSRQIFLDTHTTLLEKLMNFRMEVLCDPDMAETILHKNELKTTGGYSLNALLDYEDPYDILIHLMVGSEGTLGFISEVTFETVFDPDLKAAAWLYFPTLSEACRAILPLRECVVSAAELMDREALYLLQDQPGMPEILRELPAEAVAVLIETEAYTPEDLDEQCEEIKEYLADIEMLTPVVFTTDTAGYDACWQVRNHLFPLAVAGRPRGTAAIVEDVAFRPEDIAAAWLEISDTLKSFGYTGGVMWGHLLDGSLHFTLFPDFKNREEVDKYAACMRKQVEVVLSHDGTLRAEYGTGRAMAPFVRQEWGDKLYHLMKDIKRAFDPNGLLNPGVILNRDPEIFIKNLKEMPHVDERIDGCIECGFCERGCVSSEHILPPRQSIALYRVKAGKKARGRKYSFYYLRLKRVLSRSIKKKDMPDALKHIPCPAGIDLGAWTRKYHARKRKGGGRFEFWGVIGQIGKLASSLCAWWRTRHFFVL